MPGEFNSVDDTAPDAALATHHGLRIDIPQMVIEVIVVSFRDCLELYAWIILPLVKLDHSATSRIAYQRINTSGILCTD